MSRRAIPKLRPGQVLTAAHYNRLVDAVNQAYSSVSSPMSVTRLPGMTVTRSKLPTMPLRLSKLDGALAYGGSATCSIWSGTPNSETDTEENVTVYCWLLKSGETLAAGLRVIIAFIGGYWQVIAVQCP